MKRIIIILCSALILCACSKKEITEIQTEPETTYEEKDILIDYDFTELSITVKLAEFDQMYMEPEKYLGKTIKFGGYFDAYSDNGIIRTASLIQDNTGCCYRALEFSCDNDKKFPDDYPSIGDYFVIAGVLGIRTEGEFNYFILENCSMTFTK